MQFNVRSLKTGKFIFPTKFVWWTKLENHDEIKEKYLDIINDDHKLNGEFYRQKKSWSCDVSSSFFDSFSISPVFDNYFINNVIWKSVDEMLIELSKSINLPIPVDSEVVYAWYNRYEKGDWQEIHDHSGSLPENLVNKTKNKLSRSTFSGIYLFDLNEENTTIFYDTSNVLCFSSDIANSFETKIFTEGYIMIFPSELSHYVSPCVNSRTTISFNIASNYGDLPSS